MSKKRHEPPPPKKPEFGNTALKNALGQWKQEQKKAEPPPPPKAAPVRVEPKRPEPRYGIDDESLFQIAMEGVAPFADRTATTEPERVVPQIRRLNEDAEALAQLAELVSTGDGFNLEDTDEFIEGLAKNADKGLLVPLRRGEFSVQAHLDLHGFLAEPAKAELEKFLVESRRRGHRCVLVVHGRGLHSKDQFPVIKTRMGTWLSRGRLAKIVLAFATARQVDGGAGALYVLLRK